MKRISRLLLIILMITTSIESMADCTACWKLKYIEVTLETGKELKGYIRWNDLWLGSTVSEKVLEGPLLSKINYLIDNTEWYKFILYQEIYLIEEILPLNTVVSSNKVDTLRNMKFINILELAQNPIDFSGAGDIINLEYESIELLNREPIYYLRTEGIVSETYFLSYNPSITEEELFQISKDPKYYLARKEYEKQKVIILPIAWD